MKNKLFTLAAALTLAAVIGTIYAAPALAVVIKAALVKNVDEPGRSPYQKFLGCDENASRFCQGSTAESVPARTRLVIQHVSIFSQVATGAKITTLRLTTNGAAFDPGAANLEIHPQFRGTTLGFGDNYDGNEVGPVFFEAGQKPTISIQINGDPEVNVSAYITGYLVDLDI